MNLAFRMDLGLCVGSVLSLEALLWLGAGAALLATVAAWLRRRRLGGSPKGRLRLGLAAGAVIVLALSALVVSWLSRPSLDDPSQWVGRHLRLIGVRPDGGDELFDPAGNPIGVLPDYAGRHSTWNPDKMPRHFIFEAKQTDLPFRFINSSVRVAGGQRNLRDETVEVFRREDGRLLAVLPASLRRTYSVSRLWGLRRSARTVTRVDLMLRYYLGPRGPADGRFTGPFQPGATVADDAGKGYQLTVKGPRAGEEATLELEVRVPTGAYFGAPLGVYDSAQRWRLATSAGGSLSGSSGSLSYRLRGLPLEKIAAITFNERPHEETFRNVLVRYPGRPERRHAPWLDELAAHLSSPPADPTQIGQYRFQSPAEAVECIHLVRGPLVDQTWQAIRYGKPPLKGEQLDDKQRQRVRAAAAAWLECSDPRRRALGVQLGLWAGCSEFVAPALEMVRTDERPRGEAARALYEYCKHLTPPQVHKIKQLLLTRDDPLTYRSLLNCLRWNRDQPAATAALWELAQSDKVWLWWPALSYLSTRRAIEKSDAMPDWLRRRLVARGILHLVPDAERIAPEAHRMLPGLLTPKSVQMNLSAFHEVLQATVKHVDRQTATSELIRLLKQLLAEWDAHVVEGRSSSNWYAVDRAVRQLNHWHGVNIGGLGGDVRRESSQYAFDWQAIAAQAVRWSQTGADPAKLPAGWKPGGEDLRVVWLNRQDAELSVIGVWTRPAEEAPAAAWSVMDLADDFLNYQISRPRVRGEPDYSVELKMGVLQRGSSSLADSISPGELPLKLPFSKDAEGWTYKDSQNRVRRLSRWQGRWEVWIEPARDEKSVADETGLFRDWKKDYLSGPLPEPKPRVFFRHPRPAVRQYILARRSYAGWTDAEKAFCAALDRDPDWLPRDVRDFRDDLSRGGAIQAWKRLLARKDLTVEMQVFAWWWLGRLYASGGPKERDGERSAIAFEKALSIDPELVNQQTLNAASVLSSRSGQPAERTLRWERIYRWLVSRTDETVQRSARRPSFEYSGQMRFRRWERRPASELQRRVDELKRRLKSLRERMEANFPSILEKLHRADPAAARRLLKKLKDVAAPEKLTTWQKVLPAPAKPAGNPGPATTRPRSTGSGQAGSPQAQPAASAPAAEHFQRLWTALGSVDRGQAGKAVEALAARGDRAAGFVAGRLEPAPADPEQVKGLLTKLDHAAYSVRRQAYDDLAQLGRAALPALRAALKQPKLSAQARSSIEKLLGGCMSPPAGTAAARRMERAVEVLARIGTNEARAILARLAKGDPADRLTKLARVELAPWGKAVGGVQVLLRADRAAWKIGETPTLTACLRNRGSLELQVWRDQHNGWELEVDGRWYRSPFDTTSFPLTCGPGGQVDDIPIGLGRTWVPGPAWVARTDKAPLKLTPGKHTIRAAVLAHQRGDHYIAPVRAVSRPVQITIAADRRQREGR